MILRKLLSYLHIVLLLLFVTSTAEANPFTPDCSSPVLATKTLLKNLQDDSWDRVSAAKCISGDEKIALQLKQVLDAKGIYVDYSKISNDPNFINENGQSTFAIDQRLPTIQWIKSKDGSWELSKTSIENISRLYNDTFSPYVSALLNKLPAPFFEGIFGYQIWQYLLFMIILMLSWIAGRIVDRLLYSQLLNFIEKKKFKIDPKKLLPLRTPIVWLTISVCFLGMIADLQLSIRTSQVLFFLSRLIMSISAVVLLSRLIDILSEVFLARAERTKSKLDDQLIPLVKRAGKSLVWLLGIVFILQNMGVEVTALVAFGSVSGVAIALASKDTVENLFGSLVVFIDQPFQIGEYVIIDGSIEGVIEEVGFRSTRIRTME